MNHQAIKALLSTLLQDATRNQYSAEYLIFIGTSQHDLRLFAAAIITSLENSKLALSIYQKIKNNVNNVKEYITLLERTIRITERLFD
ncbi:hypothetical protein PENTCL1PPCAC_10088 [Pristionchus entomophagus]|uniref:Uncharacterized protein n=1 Tax=Pristionchus entomophagus TaxID=358040 RepID=A0AAV5T513_9BILA|nr:hypothetical protein PENTCL1PPCAC_10088 [Pristionchus entomophagus]